MEQISRIIPPTTIMHLPDDCLSLIFKGLNTRTDRDSFGLTCQRWLEVQNSCRQSLIVIGAALSQSTTIRHSVSLYKLLQRFRQLVSLSLVGCLELPDAILAEIQSYGTKLQSLRLNACSDIADSKFSMIFACCTSLTFVTLDRCNISNVGLHTLARSCKTLRDVSISFCCLINDQGIRYLLTNCHQLRALTAYHCRNITGVGFEGCPPSLTCLNVGSCRIDASGLTWILSGGGLEYLNMSGRSGLLLEEDYARIGAGLGARLTTLNLRMCTNIVNEAIRAIALGCPLLKEWNLTRCDRIRISGWEAIGGHCRNLERLHVNRCRNFCDMALREIRNGCPCLTTLYVGHWLQLSAAALEQFRMERQGVEISPTELWCIAPNCTGLDCGAHVVEGYEYV